MSEPSASMLEGVMIAMPPRVASHVMAQLRGAGADPDKVVLAIALVVAYAINEAAGDSQTDVNDMVKKVASKVRSACRKLRAES